MFDGLERQQIFDLHRAGRYTDDEFLEQKALLAARLDELRRLLDDHPVGDFPLDEALKRCLAFAGDTADTWADLDVSARVGFQKLVFVGGEIRFDGKDFWNSPLTSIYRLNQAYLAGKSTLVAPRGIEPLLLR